MSTGIRKCTQMMVQEGTGILPTLSPSAQFRKKTVSSLQTDPHSQIPFHRSNCKMLTSVFPFCQLRHITKEYCLSPLERTHSLGSNPVRIDVLAMEDLREQKVNPRTDQMRMTKKRQTRWRLETRERETFLPSSHSTGFVTYSLTLSIRNCHSTRLFLWPDKLDVGVFHQLLCARV